MSKMLSDTFAEAVDNPKRYGKDFLNVLQTRIERIEQKIDEEEENQAVSKCGLFNNLLYNSRAPTTSHRQKKLMSRSQK